MVGAERIDEIMEGYAWWHANIWGKNDDALYHHPFSKEKFPDRLSVYTYLVKEIEEGRL